MNLTVDQILSATGGTLVRGESKGMIERVSTDTRTLRAGDLFVALSGENFDGENYVAEAIRKGAGGVICRKPESAADLTTNSMVVVVDDTLRALGRIARAWKNEVNPMVVGITGSTGKTTVKELAAHLLDGDTNLIATAGNYNNLIGVPLTLLRLQPDTTDCILEMGMNHAGELRMLTDIAQPSIGVLTNVGDAHLGNFENLDGLIAAKAELFATMTRNTTAIINIDDANSRRMFEMGVLPWEILTYGEADDAKIRISNVHPRESHGWRFTINFFKWDVEMELPLFGRWQVYNAAAAASIALLLGATPEAIAARMSTFNPPQMRSQIVETGGVALVVDCYNASPSAMIAALRSFEKTPEARHRYALLGDMAELGAFEKGQHRRVGAAAAELGLNGIFTVGTPSQFISDEARDCGARAEHFPSIESAVDQLVSELGKGDAVLIKASRTSRLERAVDLLKERLAGHEAANEEATG